MYKKPFFHFSVDDVFDSLVCSTYHNNKLFNNHLFRFYKYLNDEFDLNIDLYCFYKKNIEGVKNKLSDVKYDFTDILKDNLWLRFGPHSLDFDNPPYSQTTNQQVDAFDNIYTAINNFGGDLNHSEILRLHYFSESYELSDYFLSKGVNGLLTTDKDSILYRLPKNLHKIINSKGYVQYNKLYYYRSNLRVENLVNQKYSKSKVRNIIDELMLKQGFVIVFTHEYELKRDEIKDMVIFLAEYFAERNIPSI